jgi:hypothetical protein
MTSGRFFFFERWNGLPLTYSTDVNASTFEPDVILSADSCGWKAVMQRYHPYLADTLCHDLSSYVSMNNPGTSFVFRNSYALDKGPVRNS